MIHPRQIPARIRLLYQQLLELYGQQGWWPLTTLATEKAPHCLNNAGYHPGSYDFPRTLNQTIEICLGAILTQNTKWTNAATAVKSLYDNHLFSANQLISAQTEQIALAIKSAGYYNQKAKYIKSFMEFLQKYPPKTLEQMATDAFREKLLEVKGIGPETADCILLYAFRRCSFVVDAYTKRLLGSLQIIGNNSGYNEIKNIFETSIPVDLSVYQEYHALLVEHGKHYYSKKPYGLNDPLNQTTPFEKG